MKLFFSLYVFFYVESAFVFHLQRDFYIVHANTVAFFLFFFGKTLIFLKLEEISYTFSNVLHKEFLAYKDALLMSYANFFSVSIVLSQRFFTLLVINAVHLFCYFNLFTNITFCIYSVDTAVLLPRSLFMFYVS